MKRTLRFLFDYISPYAYIASTQIRAVASRHGCEVEAVPVLFAGMLGASGAKGPAEIPLKREYMFHDIERLARQFEIPLAPPATHPFNPLAALRLTTAVTGDRWPLVDAIFRATWVDARRVDRPEVIAQIANDLGLGALDASAAEVKSELRRATDEAIAAGAFGVPSMLIDGELFWGVDSLVQLERHLAGERIETSRLERWRALVPSATR